VTGSCYDHRKGWIEDRLEELAGSFAIDVCGFSAMSNHVHIVLRTRPDVVDTWSDEEVALRWWRLFPKRRDEEGRPAEPEPQELRMLTGDEAVLAERRRRFADLSWFMRCLSEPISRRANAEDHVTGRVWEGRFRCQRLLDEAAILACSVYVDLNPIRAGIAQTPEESDYTSVQQRIEARVTEVAQIAGSSRRKGEAETAGADGAVREPDGWLCPVGVEGDGPAKAERNRHRRASNKGYLPLGFEDYLRIVDWTGRQVRSDKRGSIPCELLPILDRVGLRSQSWVDCVQNFGRWFHRAAGRVSLLAGAAAQAGRRWFHGVSRCRQAFA
jgi:REP element-mobilizing transposase RayT